MLNIFKHIKFWIPIIGPIIAYKTVNNIDQQIPQTSNQEQFKVVFKKQIGFRPTKMYLFLFGTYHKLTTLFLCIIVFILFLMLFGNIYII